MSEYVLPGTRQPYDEQPQWRVQRRERAITQQNHRRDLTRASRTQAAHATASAASADDTTPLRTTVDTSITSAVSQSLSCTCFPFEALNPGYKVRLKRFFQPGRVLLAALHERAGTSQYQDDTKFIRPDRYSRPVHSKPRPWIVIERKNNFCLVVPITSYRGQGIDKESIEVSDHALVYTAMKRSHPLPQFPDMHGKASELLQGSIRVKPDEADSKHQLSTGSLIDFGKMHVLDYNHEVDALGFVGEECMMQLVQHYFTVRARSIGPAVRELSFPGDTWPTSQLEKGSDHIGADHTSENALRSTEKDSLRYRDSTSTSSRGSVTARELNTCDTSTPMAPVWKKIFGTPGVVEESDPAHRVQLRPDSFFRRGKVFTLLTWRETAMESAAEMTAVTDSYEESSEHDELDKVSRRRFVVFKEGRGSCFCFAIRSFQGQGVAAYANRSEYSIVYTDTQYRKPLPSEEPTYANRSILGRSVFVERSDNATKLLPHSRIVYNRIYEVIHDVKACPFGHVRREDEPVLRAQIKALYPNARFMSSTEDEHRTISEGLGSPEPSDDESDLAAPASGADRNLARAVEARSWTPYGADQQLTVSQATRPRFLVGQPVWFPYVDLLHRTRGFLTLQIYQSGLQAGRWRYVLFDPSRNMPFAPGQSFDEERLFPIFPDNVMNQAGHFIGGWWVAPQTIR